MPSAAATGLLALLALALSLTAASFAPAARSRALLAGLCVGLALFLCGAFAARSGRECLERPLRGLPRALDFSRDEGRLVRLTGRFAGDPELSNGLFRAELDAEAIEDSGVRAEFRARVLLSWPAPAKDTWGGPQADTGGGGGPGAGARSRSADEGSSVGADPDRADPARGPDGTRRAAAAPPLLAGRRLEAVVRLKRPRNFGNPGGFDFEQYAARRGAAALGFAKSARLISLLPGAEARTPALAVRRRLDRIFARLYPSPTGGLTVEGAVLRACVLGGRTGLPPESERALVASGVYHVLAVSGLQVAVLAGALVWTLSWLPVPRRAVIASACGGVALYGAVVAPSASVQRAVLMAAFTAGARLLNRRTSAVRILSLTALTLLACRPGELGDPGFQLTFGATLGLLLFSAPLAARIDARWGLSALAAASLAAQAATWPLVALWFHRIVPYGLAANLLAVPLGSAAVILGLALLPADLFGGACSGAVGSLAALCVKGMLAVASVPVGATPLSFRIAEPAPALLLGAAAALLLLAAARGPRARFAGLLLMALCLAAAAAGPPETGLRCPCPRSGETPGASAAQAGNAAHAPTPTEPFALSIDLIDVGQGDAILVGFPDGETMLVDGGGIPGSAFDIGQRVLVPELERRGIRRLGRVVLTHAHEDHGGGLREVLRELSVGELLTPDAPEEPLRETLEELARAQGARVLRIRRGYAIQEGETTVECLSPLPTPVDDPNSDSIVLRITHAGRCALLMGDAGAGVEAGLLASGLGPCDFLKVGHHGSATSTSGPLLAAAAPRVAGISVGSAARFGHPAPVVLERLREGRALVLSTFASGAVRFSACAGHLHAGALLPAAPDPWPGPPLRPRALRGPRCCRSERG